MMEGKKEKFNMFSININLGNITIIFSSSMIVIIPVVMEVLGQNTISNYWRYFLLILFLIFYLLNAVAINQKRNIYKKSLNQYASTRNLLGGGLKRLTHLYTQEEHTNADLILQNILTVIVEDTRQLLEITENPHSPSSILSSSLLLLEENGRILRPILFDRETSPRDTTVRLDIYNDPPLGGAPEAVAKNRVVYLADINSPKYKHGFKPNRPYKSLLCFPLTVRQTPIGVLDLDTTDVNLFASEDVRHKVEHHISPWLDLLILVLLLENEKLEENETKKRFGQLTALELL